MTDEEKALKIFEERMDGFEREIILCRNLAKKWQFVNLTKAKICPCEFETRESALLDLMKYFPKCKRMVIQEYE